MWLILFALTNLPLPASLCVSNVSLPDSRQESPLSRPTADSITPKPPHKLPWALARQRAWPKCNILSFVILPQLLTLLGSVWAVPSPVVQWQETVDPHGRALRKTKTGDFCGTANSKQWLTQLSLNISRAQLSLSFAPSQRWTEN